MRPSESEDFFLFSFLREAKALRIASEKGELLIFTAPTQWLLQLATARWKNKLQTWWMHEGLIDLLSGWPCSKDDCT